MTQKTLDSANIKELLQHWPEIEPKSRQKFFWELPRPEAEELFLGLSPLQQLELIEHLSPFDQRSWIGLLALDDMADYVQLLSKNKKEELLNLLGPSTKKELLALLAYAEDHAGGLMNPRYIYLRPEMTVEQAIRYVRAQAKTSIETIYYTYVLDSQQRLVGVASFRDLLLAVSNSLVEEIMATDLVFAKDDSDQEELSRLFTQHNLLAIPIVDADLKMKGIVTYDDIVEVVQEEATEDIQKLGGMEALDAPYLQNNFTSMIKKRAGWLMVLFVGQMFTASVMGYYEAEIGAAVILAFFIPLIISSGGNAGSQTSTLVIRSLAMREIGPRDWKKIVFREFSSGLVLGAILGLLGLARIVLWQQFSPIYGDSYKLIALTVGLSVLCVVLWGTIMGATLPLILKKMNFDPAAASAPFVATIVDITGLILYFSVANILLKGVLL